MVVIDAVARRLPGVLGNADSPVDESFEAGAARVPAVHAARRVPRRRRARGAALGQPRAHPSLAPPGGARCARATRRPDLFARLAAQRRGSPRSSTERPASETPRRDPHLGRARPPPGLRQAQASVVATALTNLDLHDIARSTRTYGLAGFFIVHPGRGAARARAAHRRPLAERGRREERLSPPGDRAHLRSWPTSRTAARSSTRAAGQRAARRRHLGARATPAAIGYRALSRARRGTAADCARYRLGSHRRGAGRLRRAGSRRSRVPAITTTCPCVRRVRLSLTGCTVIVED